MSSGVGSDGPPPRARGRRRLALGTRRGGTGDGGFGRAIGGNSNVTAPGSGGSRGGRRLDGLAAFAVLGRVWPGGRGQAEARGSAGVCYGPNGVRSRRRACGPRPAPHWGVAALDYRFCWARRHRCGRGRLVRLGKNGGQRAAAAGLAAGGGGFVRVAGAGCGRYLHEPKRGHTILNSDARPQRPVAGVRGGRPGGGIQTTGGGDQVPNWMCSEPDRGSAAHDGGSAGAA